MSLYAWTQDLPIDAATYFEITDRLGEAKMPGCLVHLAIELPDGKMRYIDVWESEEVCDAAFAAIIHPAVHPVLMARGVVVNGEPPRVPLNVIDVRYADGTSVQAGGTASGQEQPAGSTV
jgi:hypothetical protein